MTQRLKTIGVFDSGMGGLSVLAELVNRLPDYDFVYYGDHAHAPYGVKTKTEIIDLSQTATRELIAHGAEAIVIACNTATSAAASHLRQQYQLPIFGMEPALKPAALNGDGGTILVMATSYTLTNPAYRKLRRTYANRRRIIQLPAPKFVNLVEAGVYDGSRVRDYLTELTNQIDLSDISAVILGCTHFLFLKRALQGFFGERVKIYDGNIGTANHVAKTLGQGCGQGQVTILSSAGDPAVQASQQLLTAYQNLQKNN